MAVEDWSPGDTIADRFRLEERIGEGGMGTVWRAEHTRFLAPVAVKLVRGDEHDGESSARFLREARACAAVRGPHVVEVLDLGVDRGTPYLAMELLAGQSLAARLQGVGRLSPEATLDVVTQAARGVARAHRRGIVHRDLKPSNIHLVPDEETDRDLVKVLDFGIAKTSSEQDAALTSTGAMLGTPQYMSPEQLRGARSIDHRSDLFSLAIVAFECLVGRTPVVSKSAAEIVVAMATKPLPKPTTLHGALPRALDAWFARATHPAPAERFDSARELVDSLRDALVR